MDRDEPKKPIPTTASHSDSECDESQPHQPPLKEHARPAGAKQAEKSVETNNDATPDADPMDTNPVDEFTSTEIALQNEIVLESLFLYMNQSDLLRCRVVNKQWHHEATKTLRRRKLVIKFFFSGVQNWYGPVTVSQDISRVINECRTLSLLSSFQVTTGSQYDLSSPRVRRILGAVGNRMKNLKLHLNYFRKTRASFETSSLMTDLRNLLFCQTPNLEFLKIKFDLPSHWKYELQTLDSSSHFTQNENNALQLLPNLKTFIATGKPPLKFFSDVINAAVNLKSFGGVFSSESPVLIKYFMGDEERDKIHLLKYLRIHLVIGASVVKHYELDTDLLETFLVEHKNNLKLETFECVFDFVEHQVSFEPSIVNAINQLLECSSESLQKLKIDPLIWLIDLVIIPRLPELKEICFDCISDCDHFDIWADMDDFIPRGFNMSNRFPNVSSIGFKRCPACVFHHVVHSIEITEPAPSVRHIIMDDAIQSSVPLLASDFRHVFPKLVSISYCDEHYSYQI